VSGDESGDRVSVREAEERPPGDVQGRACEDLQMHGVVGCDRADERQQQQREEAEQQLHGEDIVLPEKTGVHEIQRDEEKSPQICVVSEIKHGLPEENGCVCCVETKNKYLVFKFQPYFLALSGYITYTYLNFNFEML
jgi:hypothetical protein